MKLYQHQLDIIDENKTKTGIFQGTGSGKTLTTLLLARGKTLVICPKTTRDDRTWERQAEKANLKLDLTVISKEDFRRDWEKLPPFQTLIVDEAHTCLGVTPNTCWRNKKPYPKSSQLFDRLSRYCAKTLLDRLYLVTATPNRSAMTVWGAAHLLGADWDFYRFRDTFYFRLPMPGREVWTPKTDDATKDRLAQCVKNIGYVGRLQDFFDVPLQSYKTIHLEMTPEQKKRWKDIKLEYPDPLVLCGKRHQIENGVLSGDEFNKPEEFPNEKIEKLLELALEFPKMIVFAKYTAQIAQIASKMTEEGYKVLVLDGSTKDRGSLLVEANNASGCILVVQSQVSAGWEAPDFPVMVFASMDYSLVNYLQSIGRILRVNHLKKNLYIHLVIKGGVDEEVYEKVVIQKMDFHLAIYSKDTVEC